MLRTIRKQLKNGRRNLLMKVPKMGYANLSAVWWKDRTWMDAFQDQLLPDGRAGTRMLDRRFMLIQLAQSVARLRGSSAECGVARGTGSALICSILSPSYANDEFHFALDSFEGVSEPTGEDKTLAGNCNWYKGKLSHDYESVQERLSDFDNCKVVKGWIPDCFASLKDDEQYRFIHIDVDLYDPTRASLEYFFPRLVPGGVILFDDHGFQNCPGARKAATDFFQNKRESVVELTTCQAFAIKSA